MSSVYVIIDDWDQEVIVVVHEIKEPILIDIKEIDLETITEKIIILHKIENLEAEMSTK